MRFLGLDVHRDFCEVAISDGGKARRAGRVASRPAELELFARSLGSDDRVVLEATGNALAIARIIEPHVGEVVLAHARKVRAIAEAKVKTDAIDACTLAELLAADLVPRVWLGDERTRLLRRLVSRRPPRPPHRRGRRRAQAGRARLAPLEPRRGLRLPTPLRRSAQAPPTRTEDGRAAREAPGRGSPALGQPRPRR